MRSFRFLQGLRASRTCRTPVPVHQIRQFHATRPTPFINEVLDISSSFIHGVHSFTGLPWVASIPLTALIVRMTVAMPLQMYTKVQSRKEQTLAPILSSWQEHYKREARQQGHRPRGEPLLAPQAVSELVRTVGSKRRSLHSSWGVHRYWKPVTILQMPVWISVMESLRAMSGNNRGLVPYLLSLLEPASAKEASSPHLAVEPSLATEGAFWFPDLLAGDPSGILPLVLTASILLNISLGWKVAPLRELADLSTKELKRRGSARGLRLFLQALALNVGFASFAYEMPIALLIYWITSTNTATVQSLILDKFMFTRSALKHWKRIYVGLPQSGRGWTTPKL